MKAALGLFILLTSCLFETRDPDAEGPGYVSLQLQLRPNANALLKVAAGDTIFQLDSLVIKLVANGAETTTTTYAISGRADSSAIALGAKVFTLASLRSWTAHILTIDTTLNPSKQDTVHRDSVTFTVNPGDTAFVIKSVNPAFAILRARLVSNSPGDIANNVKYVRIKVDGATRDSTPVGPAFRAVSFGNSNTGIAVGDSGNMIRTTNSGANWSPVTSGVAANLTGICMSATNTGYAVGAGGIVRKTTNGTTWNAVTSNTSVDLNGTWFRNNSNGWAVGDGGLIIKTTNGTSFTAQTSGVAADLLGVHFSSANNGNAVGRNGTILRTTNGGTNWNAQTSNTSQDLNAVHMTGTNAGFAVGNGGVILKYTSGTWAAQTSNTTADLTDVWFRSASTGTVVGKGGVVLTTTNTGATWTLRTSGTTEDLFGIGWSTNSSVGVAMGELGNVIKTTNNSTFTRLLIGTKSFDVLMAYKYFTPNLSHTLLLDAVDSLAGPLRGYQAVKTVLLSPGKDTTVTPNSSLDTCGYAGFPDCQ